MPYEYWCRPCDAVSPARHDAEEGAVADRDAHRASVHGGLAPAGGDGVRRVHADARGDGCLPSGSFLGLLFLLALVLANCWGR